MLAPQTEPSTQVAESTLCAPMIPVTLGATGGLATGTSPVQATFQWAAVPSSPLTAVGLQDVTKVSVGPSSSQMRSTPGPIGTTAPTTQLPHGTGVVFA